MIGGLKIITVKAGYENKFEQLFKQLREQMRLCEPGCLLYSLLKSQTDPHSYIVHERYANQAALDEHNATTHGAEYFPQIRAILDNITVEYFDVVVE